MNAFHRSRLGLVSGPRPMRPSCAINAAPSAGCHPSPAGAAGRHSLLGDWVELLRGFSEMDSIVTMTSHPAASLAVMGSYPDLDVSDNGLWAANEHRRLSLDFSSWREVRSVEEHGLGGPWRAVEVFDRNNARTHAITLLSRQRTEEFYDLLAEHREIAPITPWRLQAVQASAPWQSKLRYRIPVLALSPGVACARLEVGALPDIFRALQAGGVGFLTGVYTEAAIQRHAWIIAEAAEATGWLYARNPQTALHLSLADLLEAWCIRGKCNCCGEDRWTIEIYDHTQKLACTLQAADDGEETAWRDIIRGAM